MQHDIGGGRVKLTVAHIKLLHSRAFLVRAYLLQTQEMLFDAPWQAFRVFGGLPARDIYENMKTAVGRVERGKQRDVNAASRPCIARQANCKAILPRGPATTSLSPRPSNSNLV